MEQDEVVSCFCRMTMSIALDVYFGISVNCFFYQGFFFIIYSKPSRLSFLYSVYLQWVMDQEALELALELEV